MNILQQVLDFMGLSYDGMVIGFIGAAIAVFLTDEKDKLTWKTSLTTLLVGIFVVGYVKPAMLVKLNMGREVTNLVSLLIGFLSKELLMIVKIHIPKAVVKKLQKYTKNDESE